MTARAVEALVDGLEGAGHPHVGLGLERYRMGSPDAGLGK